MKNLNYHFVIKPVQGGLGKVLTIDSSKTFSEFDKKIREIMGYDTWDHLSGFYEGKPFCSSEITTISPDGFGKKSNMKIKKLGLKLGDKFGYVYDFGDCIECIISVENIT